MQRLALIALFLGATAGRSQADEIDDIYQQRCASCHGKKLAGGNAQSMIDGVWRFGADDNSIFRNIKFGISAVGMPNYGPAYSDEQIRGMVKYIRAAQNDAGVEPPPLPEKLYARDYDVAVTTWIDDELEIPWALTFVDERTALLTERPGRLRLIRDGRLEPEPVSGLPEILPLGQGGLMDVAIDPAHADNGWVYLAYSQGNGSKNEGGALAAMTRVSRGRIVGGAWTDDELVFEAPHETFGYTSFHFGCRLAFDHEGHLYFSIGDRGTQDEAQDPRLPNGKIHRVWPDGSIPQDNPFADGADGMPSVYCYGNRNPQGIAVHPTTGRVWESEHGPLGGDEINIIESGVNYGWPKITYGLNYNGTPVTDKQSDPSMRQPVYYWAPSIAVCGIEFCRGGEFPRWDGHLIVGGLGHEVLSRLALADERVMHEETLLKSHGRVRDVAVDPAGAIYVVLNSPDIVLKLTNAGVALRQ